MCQIGKMKTYVKPIKREFKSGREYYAYLQSRRDKSKGKGKFTGPAYYEKLECQSKSFRQKAHGAAYRAIIGAAPVCQPGDHRTARLYLKKIYAAVKIGHWTPVEWARLYKLKRKWEGRAKGQDQYFELYGNQAGRKGHAILDSDQAKARSKDTGIRRITVKAVQIAKTARHQQIEKDEDKSGQKKA